MQQMTLMDGSYPGSPSDRECDKCHRLLYKGDSVLNNYGTLYCSEECAHDDKVLSEFLDTQGFRPGTRCQIGASGPLMYIVSKAYRRSMDTYVLVKLANKLAGDPTEVSIAMLSLDLDRLPWIDLGIRKPMDSREYLVTTNRGEFFKAKYSLSDDSWTHYENEPGDITHFCELFGPI